MNILAARATAISTFITLVGCSSVVSSEAESGGPDGGFDSEDRDAGTDDPAVDAAPNVDAGPNVVAWDVPIPISEINSSSLDVHASITSNRLRLCFASDRPGGAGDLDIWCATRADVTSAFSAPVNQVALNTIGRETFAEVTPGGNEIYFTGRDAGDPDDIYRAIWNGTQYSNPVNLSALNSSASDRSATRRRSSMFFHSDRGGDLDLYSAEVIDGAWQNVAPLAVLNTVGFKDAEPQLNNTEDFIVFCSDRPGSTAEGEALWGSELLDGTWQSPELLNISDPNGVPLTACGPSLNNDGSLLFHSDRAGGMGLADIYIAQAL